MPSQLRAHPVDKGQRVIRKSARLFGLSILIALVHGCPDAPRPALVGADPSQPSARAPAVGYRSTTTPYTSRRPAEPTPWREQNERVAPPPRKAE